LVAVKEERLYNIWFLPDGKTESAKKLTSEEGRDEGNSGMSQTPDGKIAYTARIAGTIDIWTVNADGGGNRQLTFNQGSNYSPAVSPDGKSIVFISNRAGNQDFWRMDIDGGNQTRITNTPESEGNPNFTPDGKSLIYHRTDEKRITTIWRSDADGKNPVQITETETNRPAVSPDGKFIACDYETGKPDDSLKLAVFSIDGGKPVKILDLPKVIKSRTFRWTNDGEALIYVDAGNRTQNLWKQTLDGKPPTQLTFFESGQIIRFNFAADGKSLILSRGNDSSDVVLFSNFR
jgi:Tol biopolymer transport system component